LHDKIGLSTRGLSWGGITRLRSPFHISNSNVLVFSNRLLKSRCKSASLSSICTLFSLMGCRAIS
jgi:hypothetical protein